LPLCCDRCGLALEQTPAPRPQTNWAASIIGRPNAWQITAPLEPDQHGTTSPSFSVVWDSPTAVLSPWAFQETPMGNDGVIFQSRLGIRVAGRWTERPGRNSGAFRPKLDPHEDCCLRRMSRGVGVAGNGGGVNLARRISTPKVFQSSAMTGRRRPLECRAWREVLDDEEIWKRTRLSCRSAGDRQ